MKLLRLVERFLLQRPRCSYLNRGPSSDVNLRHSSHISAGGREDMAAEKDRHYRLVVFRTSAVPDFVHKFKKSYRTVGLYGQQSYPPLQVSRYTLLVMLRLTITLLFAAFHSPSFVGHVSVSMRAFFSSDANKSASYPTAVRFTVTFGRVSLSTK